MNSLWLRPEPLVLASGSVTRRLLLEGAGIPVEVCPAEIDERAIERPLVDSGAETPAIAVALARAKALAVSRLRPGALVLGADQTLSQGAVQFHKPASAVAARRQIAALAGATHMLDSAVALARNGAVMSDAVRRATLTMRPLSDAMIDRYVEAAGAAARASVGGYQLEGLGIHLFERIEGDHSTILGLPLLPLLEMLRAMGALAA